MAIDLNMGCPKPFSVHSGMGAALLSDPVRAKEVLIIIVLSFEQFWKTSTQNLCN